MREVVITGTGVVSPIGIGKQAFWQSLIAGTSGVKRLTLYDPSALPVPFGGEISDFQPKDYVTPRKSLKVMCREIQTGFSAARLALTDAHLPEGAVDPDRLGVLFGSEMLYSDLHEVVECYRATAINGEFDMSRWGPHGMTKLFPLWMLLYLPNMAACHIAIAHDGRGPNNTISQGDASSLLAFTEAVHVIERGLADVMIVGGTGTRLNPTPLMFRGDKNLSHRTTAPDAASRPFDAQRDGIVNGEGAGAFVLEAREYAEGRGATIQARVLGTGSGFDGPPAARSPEGLGTQHAIRCALREAGLAPGDLGHVNAHGVSTRDGDRLEAAAIRATVGEIPVTAPKSFFGNLGAGSGMVEMAASVLAFEHDCVPVTLNYEDPDPECDINVIRGDPRSGRTPTALILNQSSTGQSAAVIIGR
jgi:3-oxoacyl-[acyl-carrier-protein] synthase II